MLSIWQAEDYGSYDVLRAGVVDPWEPARIDVPALRLVPTVHELRHADFWDPLPPDPRPDMLSHQRGADWFDAVALPLFDAHASESPFEQPVRPSVSESEAARHARWLTSLLDVPSPTTRKAVIARLTELFSQFDHPNTFRALSDLALDDVSADDLLTAYQLKMAWANTPKLWCVRPSKRAAPVISDRSHTMLTWTKATRLASLSGGVAAELIIDEDWFDDWLIVPFGDPAFWSFLDYAIWRREAFAAGVLDLPRELRRTDENGPPRANFDGNAIDGVALGSRSRTGQLMRLRSDAWAASCRQARVFETEAEEAIDG